MKTISKILIILLVLAVSFGSCKKDAAEGMLPVDDPTEEPVTGDGEFPVEVPYADFSVYGTGWHWNYEYYSGDHQLEFIKIVNNFDELQFILVNTFTNPIPPIEDVLIIDFSKQTLLLALTKSMEAPIFDISKEFYQSSEDTYEFYVEMTVAPEHYVPQKRFTAIITDKLSDDANIELKTNIIKSNKFEQDISEVEMGMYLRTYPDGTPGLAINFIDHENLVVILPMEPPPFDKIESKYRLEGYWLFIDGYTAGGGAPWYFRIINKRKFETEMFRANTDPSHTAFFEKID